MSPLAKDPPSSQRWALYASHLGSYMRRWILRTPWGTLRIHNILKSDEGRDLHDHPFHFRSFIFSGGYVEHVPGCRCTAGQYLHPCQVYLAPCTVNRKATALHRLELWAPAWTFVISSRYIRKWGFVLSDGTWIPWDVYHRSFYKGTDHESAS